MRHARPSSATRRTDDRRGLSLGAGRLHQRLRHRPMAGALRRVGRTPSAPAYARSASTSCNRAPDYVAPLRPDGAASSRAGDADGAWRLPPDEFDPRVWGYDYTETNGWNCAFHAPHDGRGLANLYGGRAGLAKKLDDVLRHARRPAGRSPGSYGGIIHEMTEARDVRMGHVRAQQPAVAPHHRTCTTTPASRGRRRRRSARSCPGSTSAARSARATAATRTTARCRPGTCSARSASTRCRWAAREYAIGSPLFTKATVHLENGDDLVINAPDNSPENVYVQGLKVNGAAYDRTSLPHALLAAGGALDFAMGPARRPGAPPPAVNRPRSPLPAPLPRRWSTSPARAWGRRTPRAASTRRRCSTTPRRPR